MTPVSPLHDAARLYASWGWRVFPLAPNTKVPLIAKRDGGNAHLDATTDLAQIDAWWQGCPNANIGLNLPASGLCVLDVDTSTKKNGERKKGRESLEKIDHELTDSLTSVTPRGGLHVLYQRPADMPPRRQIDVDDGLDVLSDGYIVLAPSVFVDKDTGLRGEYHWSHQTPIAPLPPYLENLQRSTPEKVQLNQSSVGTEIVEGGRNLAMFRLGCALRAQGLGAAALAAAMFKENQERFKPPLDDGELATIHEHVMQQVTPHRDAAAGALVEQEIAALHAVTEAGAQWVENVSQKHVPPTRFTPTGIQHLDDALGGGLPSRRVVGVVAPPSCGKTAFVDTIAANVQGLVPVLDVSTELEEEELFIRQAAKRMEFPWRDGVKGLVPRPQMQDAVKGLHIKLLGCDVLDRNDPLGHIWREAAKMKEEHGVAPIIIIDYVQLLARGAGTDITSKVGELSLQIRVMAQVLDTCIIAVFSTSRAYYGGSKALESLRKTNDPVGYLAAAKSAGEIEYDCAVIVFLDVDQNRPGQPKPARAVLARNRMGDVCFVGLRARLDIGKWYGDPSALAEMTVEAQTVRAGTNRLDKACERLLEVIKTMPNRAWREQRMAAGLPFGDADDARARLIETGRLRLEKLQSYNSVGRAMTREVLVLVTNNTSESPVAPDEE